MSGSATINEGRTAAAYLFIRVMLVGLLLYLYSPIGQLLSFWQASQIISPGAFPDLVLLQNSAVPMVYVIAAVLLTIGFMTKFTAGTLLGILVAVGVLEWMAIDSLARALDWLPRLTIIFGLAIPAMFGAGRWSVDGLIAARLSARAAQ